MKRKNILKVIVSVLIILAVLFLLQRLLVPKYVTGIVEGALIAEYYQEEKDHDVVFIGDCEVYENFSPVVLWKEYGINSYIRGSAQQLIWQSYYLLEDTLRYETPDVIVFNVLSLKYNEPQSEAYNRMSIEGMKWSPSKVKAIQASMTEEEKLLDYVFPILRYHSRWSELKLDDFRYLFYSPKVSHNGYYMRIDVKPAGTIPEGKVLADYSFGDNAWSYLEKMTALCKEKGIELVLIKAPSLYPYWYPEWDEQLVAFASENQLKYYNLLEMETGIDFSTDTYDGGLHLNLAGAEKLSEFFGHILQEECGLADRRNETELNISWLAKIDAYEQEIKEQQKALAEGKPVK